MRLLIKGFGLLLAPIARRFDRALQNPQVAQAQVQQQLVDRLSQSEYGRTLGVKSCADWDHLPIVTYDDWRDWLRVRCDVGGDAFLHSQETHPTTPEPILFYEKTSGSRGAEKLIPYTKSLRRSFSQMFCVWAYDLIQHIPFIIGKVYFCVSPKLNADVGCVSAKQNASLPTDQSPATSLQTDADYLDRWLTLILSPFLVTLPDAHRPQAPEEFKHKLAIRLLEEETLEIISIWNPSFLKVILDYITANRSRLQSHLRPDRAQLLNSPNIPWEKVWPQLKLISCWDAAGAKEQAKGLRSRFPHVLIQGKGLLATEAPMTIPLIAAQGCVPVLDEVFFEFEDGAGKIWLLHELAIGPEYQLIISQKGGLYRYRIGDRVRVTHYYHQTPCLEFLGRSGGMSDMVGEKLNPDFVGDVLAQLDLLGGFKTLVPIADPPHYRLLLDQVVDTECAEKLERLLCQSYHYNHARSLGQLAQVQIMTRSDMAELWAKLRMQHGARWGDIKDEILVSQPIDLAELG
jgi:GH3 auxin-responsive promoter